MATKKKTTRPTKAERDRDAALTALVALAVERDGLTTRLEHVSKSRDEISDELTGLKQELEMKKRHIAVLERGNDRLQDEITRLADDNRSLFSLLKSEREKRPVHERTPPAAIKGGAHFAADVAAAMHAIAARAGGPA